MSVFRRRRPEAQAPEGPAADATGDADQDVAEDARATAAAPPARTGPLDVDEVDGPAGRADFGALWLPRPTGATVQLEVDQTTQRVQSIVVVFGDSPVQVQVYAAPRSGGLWAEIREEIARDVVARGGTADEVDGPLGTELKIRVSTAGPGGRTVYAPVRMIGVDGARWFLRAAVSGPAAVKDDIAAAVYELIADIVVVRGSEPMAPREPLALKIPSGGSGTPRQPETTVSGPELDPFERGPEISEVR